MLETRMVTGNVHRVSLTMDPLCERASVTTNFLNPCNEEGLITGDQYPTLAQQKYSVKRKVGRSLSCDVMPRKPHPFRSPMLYLKTNSLHKRASQDCLAKLSNLNIVSNRSDSDWRLEECVDFSPCSPTNTTTMNNPFQGMSEKPYYSRRLNVFNKTRKSRKPVEEPLFEGHYATMKPPSRKKSNSSSSLRRRASSLDFLPDLNDKQPPTQQYLQQLNKNNHDNNKNNHDNNKNNNNEKHFSRSTSMSQRSPFRKKQSEDNTQLANGVKEMKPKDYKRAKSVIYALFDAIERNDLKEVKRIVNSSDENILNRENNDRFTPLDTALLLQRKEIIEVLLKQGARENPQFFDPESRSSHLNTLVSSTEARIHECSSSIINSPNDIKDNERTLRELDRRFYILKTMKNGFRDSVPPSTFPHVDLAPLSNTSILVFISLESPEPVTRYKVQWSQNEEFASIEGESVIADTHTRQFVIDELDTTYKRFVRVQAGNIKGYSAFGYPSPAAVTPSSWRDCESTIPRFSGAALHFKQLLDQLQQCQRETAVILSDSDEDLNRTPTANESPLSPTGKRPSKRNPVMKSIHKYTNFIFNSAPKLLKKIKGRGIYLASLLYCEDPERVLVTMDENLPVVECDDNYSNSFTQEFYWFSKTSCTWEDIDEMLTTSARSDSSQSVEIRRKLMQSAHALMEATGYRDLGRIHYKPFRDSHGSVMLLSVNCIRPGLTSNRSPNMKWLPIEKLLRKINNDQVIVPEKLIPSIQDQVTSHRRSMRHLENGLYVGYLKLRTSLDTLSIMVPDSNTSFLPHEKIQRAPNVTEEEWDWLRNNRESDTEVSALLSGFQHRFNVAIKKLFKKLSIPEEEQLQHRIYEREMIELNDDVLVILICPPCDALVTSPNQTDSFSSLTTSFSPMPVQSFELQNMMTYQPELMTSYCRVSSVLELELYCTQQSMREAICHDQTRAYREKHAQLSVFQQSLDTSWRNTRWLLDALNACQDKTLDAGVKLFQLEATRRFFAGEVETLDQDKDQISDDLQIDKDTSSDIPLSCETNSCDSDNSDTSEKQYSLSKHSLSDSGFSSISAKCDTLTVYGHHDIGLSDGKSVEVTFDEHTTTCDLLVNITQQFSELYYEETADAFSGDKTLAIFVNTKENSSGLEQWLSEDANLSEIVTQLGAGSLQLRPKTDADSTEPSTTDV